jgi:hypothetical protein
MNNNIIAQSLEYYDKNTELNKEIINKIQYINIIKKKQGESFNFIELYDKDFNLLKKSKYEILGTYNSAGNIWTWGWSIALLTKELVNTSKKIFNYGFDLDQDNLFLKNELITSRFKISNKIQIDMHVAIGSYLSKKQFIFSYKIYNDNIEKNNIVKHKDLQLLNIKKNYENENYNEYYLIILD